MVDPCDWRGRRHLNLALCFTKIIQLDCWLSVLLAKLHNITSWSRELSLRFVFPFLVGQTRSTPFVFKLQRLLVSAQSGIGLTSIQTVASGLSKVINIVEQDSASLKVAYTTFSTLLFRSTIYITTRLYADL